MHDVYRRQCVAPGSLISFEIAGGQPAAFRFLNALELISLAVSLGGTESLAEHPGTMTHADLDAASRAALGITPGLVRLSIGVEHYEDLIADLRQALDVAGSRRRPRARVSGTSDGAAPPRTSSAASTRHGTG